MGYSNARSNTNWRNTSSSHKASARSPAPRAKSLIPRVNAKRGLFARLPVLEAFNKAESIVATQSHVNDGQFKHPVIIVDVQNGGDMVTVCPCTAWHNPQDKLQPRTIQEKYPYENHGCRWEYLAVEHGATTKPHNSLPVLRLKEGYQLKEQTYIDVGHYFQIETKHLLPITGSPLLNGNSLAKLVRHLVDWSEDKMPAYTDPAFITTRSSGYKPVLSPECRSLAWPESFVKQPTSLPAPPKSTAASPEYRAVGAYVPPHKRKAADISSGTALASSLEVRKMPRKSLELRVSA